MLVNDQQLVEAEVQGLQGVQLVEDSGRNTIKPSILLLFTFLHTRYMIIYHVSFKNKDKLFNEMNKYTDIRRTDRKRKKVLDCEKWGFVHNTEDISNNIICRGGRGITVPIRPFSKNEPHSQGG